MTTATTSPGAPAAPPPSPAVERRHVTRDDLEGYVRHSQLLPWLGGTLAAVLLACAGFAVWVLGAAKETASAPKAEIANVSTKVDIIKSDVQTQISQMKGDIAAVDGKVVALAGKLDSQAKDTQAAIAGVKTQVEDSQRSLSGKIDGLTTLLLTGQIVTARPPAGRPR
jgi:TolA-binding protein